MSEGASGGSKIRVLVVDDSAFARKVLREVLAREPRVEVVDIARDGLEALEKIAALKPDVVTLDLVMPNLDGVGVLQALPADRRPKILVVSFSDADTELGAQALQLGALDLVKKPTALATDRMYELSGELLSKVRALAGAHVPPPLPPPEPEVLPPGAWPAGVSVELVAIGTSTGGPQALTHVLGGLPAELPVPVAVALHIPAGYTAALSKRLDSTCAIGVVEAMDGMRLLPGTAYIAPGGQHLKIERRGDGLFARVGVVPVTTYTPSVDVLFETAVEATGGRVLGVVLTGMGDDGLRGARRIHSGGGRLLVESWESCVVYGMPRVVREAGLALDEVKLAEMAHAIVRNL